MKNIDAFRAEVYTCVDLQSLLNKRSECAELHKSSHGMMRGAYDDLLKEINRRIQIIEDEKEREDELYRNDTNTPYWQL